MWKGLGKKELMFPLHLEIYQMQMRSGDSGGTEVKIVSVSYETRWWVYSYSL